MQKDRLTTEKGKKGKEKGILDFVMHISNGHALSSLVHRKTVYHTLTQRTTLPALQPRQLEVGQMQPNRPFML